MCPGEICNAGTTVIVTVANVAAAAGGAVVGIGHTNGIDTRQHSCYVCRGGAVRPHIRVRRRASAHCGIDRAIGTVAAGGSGALCGDRQIIAARSVSRYRNHVTNRAAQSIIIIHIQINHVRAG